MAIPGESGADSGSGRGEIDERQISEQLLKATGALVWVLGEANEIRYVSPAFETYFGISPEAALGRSIDEFVDLEDEFPIEKTLDSVYQSPEGSSHEVEHRVQTERDSAVWFRSIVTPWEPETGCSLVISRDVTERREHRERLERFRNQFETAMFSGDLACWELNAQSGEVVFDDRKAHMLGYDPDRFEHYEDFTDLLHPDDYERAMTAMRDHYSGDAETYDVEYRIERADGSYMWVRDIGRITERTADGEPRLVTGAVVDAAEALDDELL